MNSSLFPPLQYHGHHSTATTEYNGSTRRIPFLVGAGRCSLERLQNSHQPHHHRRKTIIVLAVLRSFLLQLSEGTDAPENILQCFLRLINALGSRHIDTELQYSLQAIPGPEPKQEPDIRFFHAILQTNNNIQLIERYFVMDIAPLLMYEGSRDQPDTSVASLVLEVLNNKPFFCKPRKKCTAN